MVEKKQLICVNCPLGCTLDVTLDGKTVLDVSGNRCKRGVEYAQGEISDPRRMVATTVKVQGGLHPLVPVYTAAPFPKPQIFELLAQLRHIELGAPIKMGQIVLKNALDTDIDVLASRDLPTGK